MVSVSIAYTYRPTTITWPECWRKNLGLGLFLKAKATAKTLSSKAKVKAKTFMKTMQASRTTRLAVTTRGRVC